jgi:enoyl-CoA hydratase/carnithine racemase
VTPIEACDWGLVDLVAEGTELEPALARFLAELSALDRQAMIQIKRAIDLGAPHDFIGEQAAFAACFANGHAATLVRAWLNQSKNPTATGQSPA